MCCMTFMVTCVSLVCSPARHPSLGSMNNPYSLRVSGIELYLSKHKKQMGTSPSTMYDSRVRDSSGGFRSWEAIKQSFLQNSQEQRSHKKPRVQASNVIDLTEDDASTPPPPPSQTTRSPPGALPSTQSSQNWSTPSTQRQQRQRPSPAPVASSSMQPPTATKPAAQTPASGGRYMLRRPLKVAGKIHTYLEEEFVKLFPGLVKGLEEDYERGCRLVADAYGRWYKQWSQVQVSKVLRNFVESLPDVYVCRCDGGKHLKYPYIRLPACDHSMCLSCLHRHVVLRRNSTCMICRAHIDGMPHNDPWVDDEILKIMRRKQVMEHLRDRLPPESQVSAMLSQLKSNLVQEQRFTYAQDVNVPHLMSHEFILANSTKKCETCNVERGDSTILGIVKSPAEDRDVHTDPTCQTSWHHVKCLDPSIRMHVLSEGVRGFSKMKPEQKTRLLKELADGTPPPDLAKKKTNNGASPMVEGGNTATPVPAT